MCRNRSVPHREISQLIERTSPHGSSTAALESFAASPAEAHRVLAAPAQDPQALWHEGAYYYCESTSAGIFLRRAAHFLDFASAEPICVWAPPGTGPVSQNAWAPELHRIHGRFYIYFAADDGRNEHHPMWVLRSVTNDPMGPYELVGSLDTQGWAIDGTPFTDEHGDLFFVWSGWPGRRNGRQNLYLARMKNPTTLAGSRVLLATPTQSWESLGMPICEGPQVVQHDGRLSIVYSASGSWTEDYSLALLVHDGGSVENPRHWRKVGPAFSKNEHACGVGHCGFVSTPGREDWMLYHAKTSHRPGWNDREVRAQRISWAADGTPLLGSPGQVTAGLRKSA
jgi:GH43 family beta-xylosidase